MAEVKGKFMNITILRGALSADPTITDLPNGIRVHNFEVLAPDGETRHMVPIAWHDPVRPPRLVQGDEIVVVGVTRRRWFRAGGGSQSRTEVLASSVTRPGSKGARRAVAAAMGQLSESGPFG
jgi:single-strand DNA-binding protein